MRLKIVAELLSHPAWNYTLFKKNAFSELEYESVKINVWVKVTEETVRLENSDEMFTLLS